MKKPLRKQMLDKRNALNQEEIKEKSKAAGKLLFSLEEMKEAKIVAFYLPKGSELDTNNMIESALKQGKRVLVPVTNEGITMVEFESFDSLVKGKYGILEPKERKTIKEHPDVIVVPGIAFGLCMHRIGYGKGYYDMYLRFSPAFRVGICFDFQVLEKLPSHENDERMDNIITEKRIIRM